MNRYERWLEAMGKTVGLGLYAWMLWRMVPEKRRRPAEERARAEFRSLRTHVRAWGRRLEPGWMAELRAFRSEHWDDLPPMPEFDDDEE